MRKLCVFCGGSPVPERYGTLAEELGGVLAREGIELVYGGGGAGLMGRLAEGALQSGGRVHGVITDFLLKGERAHAGLAELAVVSSMHERKRRMYELADAFLVLPGGIGTLDELWEVLVWNKLGLHRKPVYLLNRDGFYDALLAHLVRMRTEGFVCEDDLTMLSVVTGFDPVVADFRASRSEVSWGFRPVAEFSLKSTA